MTKTTLKAMLVDPSLFTAPYDAALTHGLLNASIQPMWATRPLRKGDAQEIPAHCVDAFFYKWIDGTSYLPSKLRALLKGFAHAIGLSKVIWKVLFKRIDVVHFQWAVIPILDAMVMRIIRCFRPVFLTVHDTTPFNGEQISFMQNLGFDLPISSASQVIVHTQSALQSLIKRGVPERKINIIPHGPLSLGIPLPLLDNARRDKRWTFVMFGEIKTYKGFDLLVEAVALLPESVRNSCRCIVAGRPRMNIDPILERIAVLGLSDAFDVRPKRLTEEEMAALFVEADCFIFPYRQIDASGVYFLVKGLSKWLIASQVGIFAEDMQEDVDGHLVSSGDVPALAKAMNYAIENRPVAKTNQAASSWGNIGLLTRACYEKEIESKYAK